MARLSSPSSPKVLAGFLAGAGVMHFATPKFVDSIVPKALPNPRFWTHVSGVAELGVAAAVAHPRTRRAGGAAAAVLFVAVFPANIQAAASARTPAEKVITWARLPLQAPLVRWALRVRADAA